MGATPSQPIPHEKLRRACADGNDLVLKELASNYKIDDTSINICDKNGNSCVYVMCDCLWDQDSYLLIYIQLAKSFSCPVR